jgi:hypothetical protein
MEMTDQVLTHESVATDATDAPTSYRRAEAAMWAEHGAPGPRERWVEVAAAGTRVRVLEHGQGRPVLSSTAARTRRRPEHPSSAAFRGSGRWRLIGPAAG